jgi:hypothetical protein
LPNTLVELVNDIDTDHTGISNDSDESDDVQKPKSVNLNIKPGDRVEHEYFGKGTITSIDDEVIAVNFDSKGKKELAIEYAKLVKIS